MRRWSAPAAVALLALILRWAAVVHLHAWTEPPEENRIIASNLASGEGFTFAQFSYVGPTTIRPPMYPFILVVLDHFAGLDSKATLFAALAINSLAGAAAAILAMAIVRPIKGDRAALIAGLLIAVWPTQLFAAAQFQGLALAVMLALAMLWLCQRQFPIAAGAIGGLAVLCESILLLPLLIVGIYAFRRRPDALILLPMTLFTIVLPWAYRNTLIRERPTLVTGQFAADLFRGNGPGATGSTKLQTAFDRLTPPQFDALRRRSEAQRDEILFGFSKDWIVGHPLRYAWLCVIRATKTLWLDWDHTLATNVLNLSARTVALVASIAALLRCTARTSGAQQFIAMCVIFMIGLMLAAMFTLAEARNSVLMDVPQLLLGATLLRTRPA